MPHHHLHYCCYCCFVRVHSSCALLGFTVLRSLQQPSSIIVTGSVWHLSHPVVCPYSPYRSQPGLRCPRPPQSLTTICFTCCLCHHTAATTNYCRRRCCLMLRHLACLQQLRLMSAFRAILGLFLVLFLPLARLSALLRTFRWTGLLDLYGSSLCFLGQKLWKPTGTRPYQSWTHWMPLLICRQ